MSKDVTYEVLTFRVPKKFGNHIRRITLTQSNKSGKRITLSELIRETLLQAYPLPKKERDMFDKETK